MAQLSDTIERFIKALMEEESQVDLRRNELAQHFGCAPSQINYVLATRFSVNHGYLVETRRGGVGYVRIVRMCAEPDRNLLSALLTRVGNSIDADSADALIENIAQRKIITQNEAKLMRAAVNKNALALPVSAKDVLRAAVLSSMLKQAFCNQEEGNGDDV